MLFVQKRKLAGARYVQVVESGVNEQGVEGFLGESVGFVRAG